MKADNSILYAEQQQYILSLLPPRRGPAAAQEAYAAAHGVPIVNAETGQFLFVTARAIGARRILELGTATGYSGLHLARALPSDGRLVTIDVDPERQRMARAHWAEAGVADQVETILGKALDVLPTLRGPFDLLFIDAIKPEYRAYLDLALPLLRSGAVVLADNVLWSGRVARGEDDESSNALRDFNRYATSHPRLDAVIVPIGDGVLYGTVRE
jgi:predicted O-methyltransferase YrrM